MTIRLPRTCRVLMVLLLGFAASPVSFAQSEARHEFLLFPSIGGLDTQDESDALVADSDLRASLDGVYSYSGDHFRFLAEYLVSNTESELERLQAGWSLADNAWLWFGRHHSPSRFWVSEFHHGQYMQTSITRPSLEEWEDESGSTPSHLTGLLLEFDRPFREESAIEYALSAGLAPRFVGNQLEPFDTLDPRSGHGLSLNARIGYRAAPFETVSFGLLGSWNEINAERTLTPDLTIVDRIDQATAGLFVNWQWHSTRLVASAVYYDNRIRHSGGTTSDDFVLAYLQPEYELNDKLTVFGRADIGFGEDSSIYLRMLPGFVSHRNMLGLRWDFADFQALTFEVSDVSKQGDGTDHFNYKEFRLQWSAAFP